MGLADGTLAFLLIAYSIILHEIAHGYAALRFGDPTARAMGRLTLNPLEHVDPVGTVLFPLVQVALTGNVLLGWAKPVPVVVNRLEPRVLGEVVVALAGIAVNLAIAFAMALALGSPALTPEGRSITNVVITVMVANVALAIFNLLPIPPLDGSHVLKQFLPPDLRAQYERIGFYGAFVLLILISTRILDRVTDPLIIGILRALKYFIISPLRGTE